LMRFVLLVAFVDRSTPAGSPEHWGWAVTSKQPPPVMLCLSPSVYQACHQVATGPIGTWATSWMPKPRMSIFVWAGTDHSFRLPFTRGLGRLAGPTFAAAVAPPQ